MKGKVIAGVFTAVLLFPLAALGMSTFDYPVVSPVVSYVQGDVTVKEAGGSVWDDVEVGRLLSSGDTLRTGASSKAEISCATGKMRLFENTVLVVPEVWNEGEEQDIREVKIDEGTGLFKIRKRGVDKGFEVHTENIIAGVKGTLFGVKYDVPGKKSSVFVYRGVILVTDTSRAPETATELRMGEALEVVGEEGLGDRKYIDPESPWYLWKKVDSLDFELFDEPVKEEEDSGGGGHGELECAPVTDSDGNPIFY